MKVTFDENNTTITCIFLEENFLMNTSHNCTVVYRRPQSSAVTITGVSYSNVIVLNLSSEEILSDEYQFIVIANNGTFNARVEGNFVIQKSKYIIATYSY